MTVTIAHETRVPGPTRRRFTVEEYHRMIDVGVLHEDERVELLDGEIIQMPPISAGHSWPNTRLYRLLDRAAGDDVLVFSRNPLILPDDSEPQPDLVVVRRPENEGEHPRAHDALLVVEVSVSSLAYDRDTKVPRYAAAGIPEAWVLDVAGEQLRVYRDPAENEYRELRIVGRGQSVSPLTFPALSITIDDMLGPKADAARAEPDAEGESDQ